MIALNKDTYTHIAQGYDRLCDIGEAVQNVKQDIYEQTAHITNLFEEYLSKKPDLRPEEDEGDKILMRIIDHLERQSKTHIRELEEIREQIREQIEADGKIIFRVEVKEFD